MLLGELALQAVAEVALHSSRTDTLTPTQTAAIDPIKVLLEDRHAVGFAGALMGLNARQTLAELAPAIQTAPLAQLHFELAVAQPPILVPHPPAHDALAALARAAAMRAGSGTVVAG